MPDHTEKYRNHTEIQRVNGAMHRIRQRPNVVLREYPVDPSQFSPDLAPFVEEIIRNHGIEEWKAAVLTNEMHRHLGIYSILGVKMGIMAREILQAGMDDLVVDAFTGFKPPVSCMTDGLQVATGSSLGRGTISVRETDPGEASAIFRKSERSIKLALKEEHVKRVNALITVLAGGTDHKTHDYFDEIRNISIRLWLELDRRKIFYLYNL